MEAIYSILLFSICIGFAYLHNKVLKQNSEVADKRHEAAANRLLVRSKEIGEVTNLTEKMVLFKNWKEDRDKYLEEISKENNAGEHPTNGAVIRLFGNK